MASYPHRRSRKPHLLQQPMVLGHSQWLEVGLLSSQPYRCSHSWTCHVVSFRAPFLPTSFVEIIAFPPDLASHTLTSSLYSWAHEVCTADNEERAVVTGSMNQMAYMFQIWVPLVAWKQTKQPRYTAGFGLVTILNVALIGITVTCMTLMKRQRRQKISE